MSVTVKLTLGRRSITATGPTKASAQGKALAEYRKRWSEHAKGASIEVIGGAPVAPAPAPAPAEQKRKTKSKKRKAAPAPDPAPASAASAPRTSGSSKKAVKIPLDAVRFGSFLTVGTSNAGTIVSVLAADTLDGARALAGSEAMTGALRTVLEVRAVYGDTGKQIAAAQKLDAGSLRYLDRVVLGAKLSGELLEVRVIRGNLGQARAVAQSISANRVVVGTVRHVYRV